MPLTDHQIDGWLEEVGRRLRPRSHELNVNARGRGRIDEGFGVHVFIWPWSDETAERVRRELARIPVEIGTMQQLRPRTGRCRQKVWWAGAGSNRRPSAFQDQGPAFGALR